MARQRKVKYEVTGAFGTLAEGTITKAIVLASEGGGSALLYHPRTRGSCASIEMAHDRGDGTYVSSCSESDGFGWVNIENQRDLNTLVGRLKAIRYKDEG
jgi:hypothetical protein